MTEIEALRAEVAKLREEIADLRRAGGAVVHHHYHQPAPSLLPQPYRPAYPGGPVPVTCFDGIGTGGWPHLTDYSDPRMTGAAAAYPTGQTIFVHTPGIPDTP